MRQLGIVRTCEERERELHIATHTQIYVYTYIYICMIAVGSRVLLEASYHKHAHSSCDRGQGDCKATSVIGSCSVHFVLTASLPGSAFIMVGYTIVTPNNPKITL